ncbi:hypothetical protein B5S52_02100 [Pectobacterium brasiliense]|nr:hypothetical protein B5S52_02100 [Pectobacterium brasiliense]
MMNFLSVEQGSRPSRPVVIRPAGDGLAAPLVGATQWSAWKRKEFVPRGMRAAQGKLFSLEGCSHRSPATARIHKQTGRLGPTRSERNMADSAPRVTASPACALMRASSKPRDEARAPLPQLAAHA